MCQALNGSADAAGNRTHELLALVKLTCRLNKIKKEKNMARQAGAGAAGAGENRSREGPGLGGGETGPVPARPLHGVCQLGDFRSVV